MRAAIFLALALSACASNHHVSPFPDPDAIGPLAPPDDLDAQLARIDAETSQQALVRVAERRGALRDRSPIVVRGYRGVDAFGRPAWATRAATPAGVVLAVGPADSADPAPAATELVESLVPGGWWSGTDLDGDGAPEVVVRDGAGALAVWRLERLGSVPVPVRLAWTPTRAIDADDDGRPDLAGDPPPIGGADPLAPALADVATPDHGAWDHDAPAARAWHARERDAAALREARALAPKEDPAARERAGREPAAPQKPAPPDAKAKVDACRAALERAWHALRAGDEARVARDLADATAARLAPLPDGTQQAWVKWRGVIERATR